MIEDCVIKKILYENEILTIVADIKGHEQIIKANINEINIVCEAPNGRSAFPVFRGLPYFETPRINIEAYYNTFSIEETTNKQCNVSFEDLLFGTDRR